ncbi:type ISP restriction/modification enzyme [Helicobacter canadensis]|uniref:Type ISP restriction-modification enzyme LLaBIII C-terminal specificity domain-containing protein n=1 Tax=Helicobacter canadensis MIT 98-5491 TaxID=537970 RepID=C5ZXS3_9HELI|nr:type ISP restriction/modification enzyme [Helicobacter canadensis]EES89941.1 conserved hypothetical protein [Helicobacter canadensis MIT 98-5491]EFR49088.1 hypothetical protein HCMG_01261 [Helicobacter canadensis MIT 98-5491]STP02560.1 Type IIG restriction-modification enzyme [Helicobacter canadensis]
MEARENNFKSIVTNENRLDIPFFQRHYTWNEEHWERLFDDLYDSFINNTTHFVGSVILKRNGGNDNFAIVIDGQQRLTTFSILLKVLHDKIDESKRKHFENYLFETYKDDSPKINHSKMDRENYIDFLKVDFPKIPFVESKGLFLQFSALGNSLITLHSLKEQDLPPIGEPLYKDTANKDLKISKITYAKDTKELFINKSLYFEKVESSVWEYKIGGYQVLDKYLKSHKDEAIDFEYFQKIIQTLHKSLEIEREIAKISFI